MVKKFIMVSTVILLLSSCGFFGATAFPTALSERYDWFSYLDLDEFYILDNGSLELLVLVMNDGGAPIVAIFDTSLNLRGIMEDGKDGIETDGIGFIDHSGNFVIGKVQLTSSGTAESGEVVGVPGHYNNSAVIPYTNSSSVNLYMEILNNGNVILYDDIWTLPSIAAAAIVNYTDVKVLNQNNRNFSDLAFAKKNGDVFVYTKQDLYEHAQGTIIDLNTPTFSIPSSNLSGFATRCSRGYFVSTYDGDYILYGNTGSEIDRVENDGDHNQVVTIDYDSEYYYYVNRDKGIIVKERLPF